MVQTQLMRLVERSFVRKLVVENLSKEKTTLGDILDNIQAQNLILVLIQTALLILMIVPTPFVIFVWFIWKIYNWKKAKSHQIQHYISMLIQSYFE